MLMIIDCKYKILEKRKHRGGYNNSVMVEEDGLRSTSSPEEMADLLKGEEALVIRVKDPPNMQVW